LERFETGRDCVLIEEDEESCEEPDDDGNDAGEQEVSETNDAFSDTEAEAIVANNSTDAAVQW